MEPISSCSGLCGQKEGYSFPSQVVLLSLQSCRASIVSIGSSLKPWVNIHPILGGDSHIRVYAMIHKWCGGGTSWEETEVPLNELFVITGCSRADRRTDAPINFLSCPLRAPVGRAQMLLEKRLNLGMSNVISLLPRAFPKRQPGWEPTWGTGVGMVPNFMLFLLRQNPEFLKSWVEKYLEPKAISVRCSVAPKVLLNDQNFVKLKNNYPMTGLFLPVDSAQPRRPNSYTVTASTMEYEPKNVQKWLSESEL